MRSPAGTGLACGAASGDPEPRTPDADRSVACWTGCHLAAARLKGAAYSLRSVPRGPADGPAAPLDPAVVQAARGHPVARGGRGAAPDQQAAVLDARTLERLSAELAEFGRLLRVKLLEEAAEAAGASGPVELLDDLGGFLQVLYALASQAGLEPAAIECARARKARTRGAFTRRVVWHDPSARGQHP